MRVESWWFSGTRAALALGGLLSLLGCGSTPEDTEDTSPEPACSSDDAGRPSVLVSIRDDAGAALPGASVTWSADGSAFKAALCADDVALEACTRFKVGFELTGAFVVRAEKAGYEPSEGTATVGKTEDGCHVLTQEIGIDLKPVEEPCAGDAEPSVRVSVVDAQDQPLPGATVTYRLNGGEAQEATCADGSSPESCSVFIAGIELTGDFHLAAEKAGFLPAEADLSIGLTEDGCHVQTGEVKLTLIESSCKGDPVPSIQANIMDDVTWKNLPGASVTYSIDGGPFLNAECAQDVPPEECFLYIAGWDQAGTFTMRASAPGYAELEKTFTVTLDAEGCHAVTQYPELRLTPLAQTASVRVAVVDEAGAGLAGATVWFSQAGGELRLADCADEVAADACTDFVAGWNLVGDFFIRVERDGYLPFETATSVGWDEDDCEPITASVEARLSPSP